MSATVQIPRRHRLILVRHAQSRIDPSRNPREWGLSEEGQAGARRLAALGLFDRADAFYAGAEPKMIETLDPVATARDRRVQADPDFGETHSEGWIGSPDEFNAIVRRLFEAPDTPPAPGWETGTAARRRFGAAVERLRQFHEPPANRDRVLPATVAIATGGRMLMTYLSGPLDWSAVEAFAQWQRLRMPDLAVLELDEAGKGQIVVPFGTLVV